MDEIIKEQRERFDRVVKENSGFSVSSWEEEQKEIEFENAKALVKKDEEIKAEVKDFREALGLASVKKKCYNLISKIRIK